MTTKRDFLGLEDFSWVEIEALLSLAERIKRGEVAGGLEGRIMAMAFLDPSLRTRNSFESAMFLHGGLATVIEPGKGSWAWETDPHAVMDGDRVENIVEAARVLGRYADVVGVRAFARGKDWAEARLDRVVRSFAEHCEKPVINLESARQHPCQALADALTIREKMPAPWGRRFVVSWAWHPKPLPTAVPVSAALAAARLGMEVVIARPTGWDFDSEDMALLRRTAREGGAVLQITEDMDEACEGADVVYAKSWGSLEHFGDPAEELARRADLKDWILTEDRVRSTRRGEGLVMHCLPVRRNVEIEDRVLDGPNSVVIDQAENRLHVQRALLLDLLGAAPDREGLLQGRAEGAA
ncbi:MAG TPA: N-acetylornithine carbamoyltransferase [Gemmatimonadota bacterium]|nr:N-acetylornithine carbamoyltransferase [Gemmatimonadota bacterium]